MEKLDKIDYRILSLLDSNARSSLSDVARTVHYGRDLVHYRVERLYQCGVIRQARAVLNPYALGFMIFKTYLKLRNRPARIKQLISRIIQHPATFCYAECDGSWDMIFNMVARSPFEFDEAQDQLLSPFHDLLVDRDTALTLRQSLFQRKYLTNSEGQTWQVGGEVQSYQLEELDLEILKYLVLDARLSLVELAARSNSTPIVVKKRMQRMESAKAILGYRLDLDRKTLGYSSFKAQVSFLPQTRPLFDKLAAYCSSQLNVMSFIHQLGRCRLECNLDTKGYDQCHEVTDDMRQRFLNLIESISMLAIREERFVWLQSKENTKVSARNMQAPCEIGMQ